MNLAFSFKSIGIYYPLLFQPSYQWWDFWGWYCAGPVAGLDDACGSFPAQLILCFWVRKTCQGRLNLCVQMHSDKQLSGLKPLNDSAYHRFFFFLTSHHWLPSCILLLQMSWTWVSGSECLCIFESLIECPYTSLFVMIKNANLIMKCFSIGICHCPSWLGQWNPL